MKTVTFRKLHTNRTVKINNRLYHNPTFSSVNRLMKCYFASRDHGKGGPGKAIRYFKWEKGVDYIL
jgi:hypothetical protein